MQTHAHSKSYKQSQESYENQSRKQRMAKGIISIFQEGLAQGFS